MSDRPLSPRKADGLLTALAAVTAWREGMDDEIRALIAGDPDAAFMGIVAVAVKALDEIAALGGDPAALALRIYAQASRPAS